jgi:hypothetical protein
MGLTNGSHIGWVTARLADNRAAHRVTNGGDWSANWWAIDSDRAIAWGMRGSDAREAKSGEANGEGKDEAFHGRSS